MTGVALCVAAVLAVQRSSHGFSLTKSRMLLYMTISAVQTDVAFLPLS